MNFVQFISNIAFLVALPVVMIGVAISDDRLLMPALLMLSSAICIRRVALGVRHAERDYFNPVSVFVIAFFFFHLLPVWASFLAEFSNEEVAKQISALWVTLIGIVAFEGALIIFKPVLHRVSPLRELNTTYLTIVPAAVIFSGPILLSFIFGPAIIGFIAVIFALVLIRETTSLPVKVYAVAIILISLLVSRGEFTRAFIGQTLALIFLFINYYHFRFKGMHFIAISILGVVMLFGLNMYRSFDRIFPGETFAWGPLLERARFILVSAATDAEWTLILFRSFDFPMAYKAYVTVVNSVPSSVGYLNGETYLRYFYIFIPRSIFPEKPLPMAIHYPKVFLDRFLGDYSISPLLLGELYWNGGIGAVVIGMAMIGVGVKYLYVNRRVFISNYAYFSVYVAILVTFPLYVRGSTPTVTIVMITSKIIPIILIFAILSALSYGRRGEAASSIRSR